MRRGEAEQPVEEEREDVLDKKNPRQQEQSKAEAELQQDFHVSRVKQKTSSRDHQRVLL